MVNYVLRIQYCFLWFPRGGRLPSSKNLKGVQSSSTRKAAPSAQLAIGCVQTCFCQMARMSQFGELPDKNGTVYSEFFEKKPKITNI